MKLFDIGDILGKQSLGNSQQSTRRAYSKTYLHISGLFDTPSHRAFSTTCLARIAKQLPEDIRIHSNWWNINKMHSDAYSQLAYKTSKNASIFWYAGYVGGKQYDIITKWIETTSSTFPEQKAFVAVVEGESKNDFQCMLFLHHLEHYTNKMGLDFFSQIPTRAPSFSDNGAVKKFGSNTKLNTKVSDKYPGQGVYHFGICE